LQLARIMAPPWGTGTNKEMLKLLFCACRDHCQNKTAPQSTTHKCPGCAIPIHPKCLFPDGEDANTRWCHYCKVGRTPSPFQRVTRRQALEKKTILPKNIFNNDMILGQGLPIDTDKDSVFTATLLGGVNEGNDTSPDTQNQGVAQLPKCACRERCQFPELPKATGHHCPGCKLAIHAACGIHDEKAGLDDSNWCYDCWDSKMQQEMPARRTSVVHQ
jgi:hypothetical protein